MTVLKEWHGNDSLKADCQKPMFHAQNKKFKVSYQACAQAAGSSPGWQTSLTESIRKTSCKILSIH